MKKFISILLAAIMMLSVFAGCKEEKPEENEPPKQENEIVVAPLQKSFTAIIYDDGDNKAFWEEVKSSFESANDGVTINMVITKDAAYEVRDRILAGNSPDFVFLPLEEESGVTEALVKDKAMLALLKRERVMTKKAVNRWLHQDDKVLIYSKGKTVFAFNFHPEKSFEGYFVPTGEIGQYKAVLSTDSAEFGGFGRIDTEYVYTAEKAPDGKIGFKCYLPSRTAAAFKKLGK